MRFDVIIPTYRREKDLKVCLESMLGQTLLPARVIVVDDDNLPTDYIENFRDLFKEEGVDFAYHQKDHSKHSRGSSESRNLGMSLASENICFILDDDLILDEVFFAKIMGVWEESDSDNLIGVGGVIKNNRKSGRLERAYNHLFGLTGESRWDVNDVAFQTWDDWIAAREKGHYVHGGVCSYKQSAVQKLGGFTAFSGGRAALEDVDFCLRAKQAGDHFMIEPEAKVIHNHSPSGREASFTTGFKEGSNRKMIFKDHCRQSFGNYLWFVWANTGWVLKQFLTGQVKKGAGMVVGLLSRTPLD